MQGHDFAVERMVLGGAADLNGSLGIGDKVIAIDGETTEDRARRIHLMARARADAGGKGDAELAEAVRALIQHRDAERQEVSTAALADALIGGTTIYRNAFSKARVEARARVRRRSGRRRSRGECDGSG